jgi:chromate transporter
MIYWQLFVTFLMIGISAFGGGYAVMPLIQDYIVNKQGWINPIMINAATFVGIKIGGQLGGIVATLGSVLPSFILVLILGYLFNKHGNLQFIQNIMKGLRPTIVGLIWVATLALIFTSLFDNALPWIENRIQWEGVVAFLVSLIICFKTKWDTLIIVAIGASIGLIFSFLPF